MRAITVEAAILHSIMYAITVDAVILHSIMCAITVDLVKYLATCVPYFIFRNGYNPELTTLASGSISVCTINKKP